MQFKIDAKISAQVTREKLTYIGTATGAIHVLNFETGQFETGIFLHNGPVSALAFTDAGVLVSGAWDRRVLLHTPECVLEISMFTDAIKSLLVAFDSLYVGTGDGMTYRFAQTGAFKCQKQHNKRFVESMCVVGRYLATAGSDRTVRILDPMTLDLVQKFDFVNSIRHIQYKHGYLFMTCAEKLFRVFELPDQISGAQLGVKKITTIHEAKLPEWGNQFAIPDDYKSSGIYVGCADKSLKVINGTDVETVLSGAGDNVVTVEVVKQTVSLAGKTKECWMVVYGSADCYIRRIFMKEKDRQYFLASQQPRKLELESSDFEDEEIRRIQNERLRAMLKVEE